MLYVLTLSASTVQLTLPVGFFLSPFTSCPWQREYCTLKKTEARRGFLLRSSSAQTCVVPCLMMTPQTLYPLSVFTFPSVLSSIHVPSISAFQPCFSSEVHDHAQIPHSSIIGSDTLWFDHSLLDCLSLFIQLFLFFDLTETQGFLNMSFFSQPLDFILSSLPSPSSLHVAIRGFICCR